MGTRKKQTPNEKQRFRVQRYLVAVFPTSDFWLLTSVSSSFPIQNSMLDVRPARNAFVQILCSAYNVDVSAAIIILTLSTLHGRRVFDVHLFSTLFYLFNKLL